MKRLVLVACVAILANCQDKARSTAEMIEFHAIKFQGLVLQEKQLVMTRGHGLAAAVPVKYAGAYREKFDKAEETIKQMLEDDHEHAETLAWAYCVLVMSVNFKIPLEKLNTALTTIRNVDYTDPDYEPYDSQEIDSCLNVVFEFGAE